MMADIQLPTVSRTGYMVQFETRSELTETASGFLVRTVTDSNNCLIDVIFELNRSQYESLRASYNNWVNDPYSYTQAGDSIYCRLIIDTHKAINYKCRFIPDSLVLQSVNGLRYNVACSLEVVTKTVTGANDDAYLSACETYGIDSDEAESALETIITELEG